MTTPKAFDIFMKESGFKILALASLSNTDYQIMLYLINCAVSGLDQLITTEPELASLLGVDESKLGESLEELSSRNLIRIHFGDPQAGRNQSIRIGLQYVVHDWRLKTDEDLSSHDALVFPFRRKNERNLAIAHDAEKEQRKEQRKDKKSTWKRVLDSFVQERSLDDDDILMAEKAAHLLVETHPVDQVLLLLRHFNKRIPSLSLLASSWSHYHELFESETQKVDILEARVKHREMDERLREQAEMMLGDSTDLELSDNEENVLRIIAKHQHPRRQLFWAYQAKSSYPNLENFFADNFDLMLAITSKGAIVKKPHNNDQ